MLWDTPQGLMFLRSVAVQRAIGVDLDALGAELGVPDLKYVLQSREDDLT